MIYKAAKNKVKTYLKNLITQELSKSSTSGAGGFDYLSSIAIKNNGSEFQSLNGVKSYINGEVHSSIFSVYPEIKSKISEMINRDSCNLPSTVDREGYHGDRHYDWWLSGLLDYLNITKVLAKYGHSLTKGDSFYEMGCASGRVLRHFSMQQDGIDVWGSDINSRHIEWMRLNLPSHVKIFQNTILPQIPIESNSINIACAFSVFTHIDDLDFAWLCEIRRVLKKGGFFYVTIHSDDTWATLNPDEQIYQSLLAMAPHIVEYKVTKEFLGGPLPKDKTVFTWKANNYNTNVFHTKAYIYREWGRFFKIQEIIRRGSQYQDVVVMQKIAD